MLDDVFAQDHQVVGLRDLLTPFSALGCGTAQGRRFSVHAFNAQLRALPVEIEQAMPGGCASRIPLLARLALRDANDAVRASVDVAMPSRDFSLSASAVSQAACIAAQEGAPWPRAEAFLSHA
jgi:hypothetical protein